jgi:Secretion system C-terminal sorting domain
MKIIIILLLCVTASFVSLSQNIIQGEYFIDKDLGVGNNILINFTPSADNDFPINIDLTGLVSGFHKLYIRTKDSNGNWSLTSGRNIELLPATGKTSIATGEYFFDADPGFQMASPITISSPDSIELQDFQAVAASLSEGSHKLYGRFKDNLGKWSLTFRRNVDVYKGINTNVVRAEYFTSTDLGFGNCASVIFTNPAADGVFNLTIPTSAIPAGTDTLFIRIQNDIENRWSLTKLVNIPNSGALPLTLLNFSVVKVNGIAELTWQTQNEINTAYFNIQRSIDAVNFINVGKVNAVNASSTTNSYGYADNISGLTARELYYRLQEVDLDGKMQYSKIVTVNIEDVTAGIKIFPNPASSYINITDNAAELNGAILTINDITGRVVLRQLLSPANNIQVNIGSLKKGVYVIKINKTAGIQTQKLIVE